MNGELWKCLCVDMAEKASVVLGLKDVGAKMARPATRRSGMPRASSRIGCGSEQCRCAVVVLFVEERGSCAMVGWRLVRSWSGC